MFISLYIKLLLILFPQRFPCFSSFHLYKVSFSTFFIFSISMLRWQLIVVNLAEYCLKKLFKWGYIVYWSAKTNWGPNMDYLSRLFWSLIIFYCNLTLFCAKYSSLILKIFPIHYLNISQVFECKYFKIFWTPWSYNQHVFLIKRSKCFFKESVVWVTLHIYLLNIHAAKQNQ